MSHVVSIQVGPVRLMAEAPGLSEEPGAWRSAILKRPVEGPVWVAADGLDGDEQADRVSHGGPDKAVLIYSAEHYAAWREVLGTDRLAFGAFGENLSVSRTTEEHVCIGDLYEVGAAVLEVAQPRQPCWKLAARWGRADLVRLVVETGRSGWYVRVRQEGLIEMGMPVRRAARPFPEWTVARAARVRYGDDVAAMRELAACPALSERWTRHLLGRLG